MNSVEENIRNAFIAVHKTHENVNKLMEYCRTIANEKTNYNTANGKILRWQPERDYYSWCMDDFILLFQRKTDTKLTNEWRDGPVYAVEIMLSNYENPEQMPTIYLSKFEYEDIASWDKGFSQSNFWSFYYPLRDEDTMVYQPNVEGITQATPKTKEIADLEYRGLSKVSFMDLPMMNVNAENVEDKIFGNFEKLYHSK
ncbi:Hypothetical protein Tpal_655 [Trichococcus palustris]|uniref:Uncharacterized protein n=1 Tax=Trichococcus palustris TaxID=140314 RepID=A0A143YCP3_9LACT|nr:hypothetical protein [Trichococcus palustris]CZQ85598.1 Hypothetical protein Tpal_655 [Trichococcus palustris]SFK56367.1 hypothetical protein SAMN04488076_101137 [Trichococcus palustris]